MFSKRKSIGGSRYWDKAFLNEFATMFRNAGFSVIRIRLPRNLIPAKEKDYISLETFFNRERNYPSIILEATNAKSKELIKVLFVNISKETYFVDDTFPSGHSQPTEIYVQSPDPGRTFSLLAFFYEYLSERSKGSFSAFSGLVFALGLMAEVMSLFSDGKLLFVQMFKNPALFFVDLFIIFIFLAGLYGYLSSPQGLHIRFRDSSVGVMLRMALRGELRDNPIVNLVVTVLGTILASILLKFLGVI
ncbi:MAG: hypothetical protein KIT08_05720 [Anaerolineales bacterium]|nr:MAG: hypothetical protein KIT08_05720 [Anaerolineales bacterium]